MSTPTSNASKPCSSNVYTIADQIFEAVVYGRMKLRILVIIILPARLKKMLIDQKE